MGLRTTRPPDPPELSQVMPVCPVMPLRSLCSKKVRHLTSVNHTEKSKRNCYSINDTSDVKAMFGSLESPNVYICLEYSKKAFQNIWRPAKKSLLFTKLLNESNEEINSNAIRKKVVMLFVT